MLGSMRLTPMMVLTTVVAAIAACGGSTDGGSGGAGGTTSDGGGGGAATGGMGGAPACFTDQGTFTSFEANACDPMLDECVIAAHAIDCCGTVRYIGINQAYVDTFNTCEAAWAEELGSCNCPAGPSLIEQPASMEVGGIDEVAVECMNCTANSCICVTVPL